MHRRNQADVSRQKQVGKFSEVLGVIELELDVERTVRRVPDKALRDDARQLAVESGDNRLALAVDANAVEPKVEVSAARGTGATVATETVCEVVAVEEVGLVAVPDVKKVERAITAVRDKASMGTQTLADGGRQGSYDAPKQF